MTTPTTPAGLAQFDHLDPVEAVARAYTERGRAPYLHLRAVAELHRTMPVLARALDRLAGPGPHERITTTVGVAGVAWRGERSYDTTGAQAHARRQVRRKWVEDLDERGLRPLGWPPITVHGYRYGDGPVTATTQRGDDGPWPEVPIAYADVVHVTITGYTVPVAS